MKHQLINIKSSLDEEIQHKRIELAILEEELAQLELDLATLNAKLTAFEIEYLKTVGFLLAKLDKLEALITASLASLFPYDENLAKYASAARKKSNKSWQEANYASRQPEEKTSFIPSEDLKMVYREIAKKIHPDLTSNEEERSLRSDLMKEVNEAYQAGDIDRLNAILHDWKDISSRKSKEERELKSLENKIGRARSRISAIHEMLVILTESNLYQLMTRVIIGREAGRDLLNEMAEELQLKIELRQMRLDELEKHGQF